MNPSSWEISTCYTFKSLSRSQVNRSVLIKSHLIVTALLNENKTLTAQTSRTEPNISRYQTKSHHQVQYSKLVGKPVMTGVFSICISEWCSDFYKIDYFEIRDYKKIVHSKYNTYCCVFWSQLNVYWFLRLIKISKLT